MKEIPSARILGRTKRLPTQQREMFNRIFQCGDGYVLDFSDRTMADWFEESYGINIGDERFEAEGQSKGKRLRSFVETAEPRLVAEVLRGLWSYRSTLQVVACNDPTDEAKLLTWFQQFILELETASAVPIEEAIKDFSGDTTLAKLRASIAADLIADKPDVALDRVHTYCVKRFRSLLAALGKEFDTSSPLDALFAAYGRHLKEADAVSEFALPTIRVQYKLFESLNHIRNKRSLAHDTELLDLSEAKFIVDCVLASLAFIERIEAGSMS